jgi:phenylalanyl-tRNA synthetase alpha chain
MDLAPVEALRTEFRAALTALDATDLKAVDAFRVQFLGKKGSISGLLRQMGALPVEERPLFGAAVNTLRDEAEAAVAEQVALARAEKLRRELEAGWLDVTAPARGLRRGSLHPMNEVREQIVDFFHGLGFSVASGREVENDWYNFEALNLPPDHPARDMQDTFYVADKVVLRTQTSSVQIHVMENQKPPIRIIAPGHVYRCDSDATHAPMFQQVEGLVVDEEISFAHLKGILYLWAQELFGAGTKIRFRPSFFPFTEPSAEMDVSCFSCGGAGCRICKQSGWIEIGGCGSVDPAVFQKVGIDPEKYTGFAFGFGIDRITMVKYRIPEIGLLTANDNRFIRQF